MKKLLPLILLSAMTFSPISSANTTILPSPNEPDLIGVAGILDSAFGLANIQRIDDNVDRFWNITGDEVTVTAVAKYAGYKQDFGFIDSNDVFNSLLYVPFMNGQSNTFTETDSGVPFRFGLDPSGSPLLSSDPADNMFCAPSCMSGQDHMVSWLLTGGQYAGDYIIAWEDLKNLGDQDYNDLVVRVSGVSIVPVPAAAWLFGSGFLALATVLRRRTGLHHVN